MTLVVSFNQVSSLSHSFSLSFLYVSLYLSFFFYFSLSVLVTSHWLLSLHSTSCTLGGIFNLSYIESSNALLHLTNFLFPSLTSEDSLSLVCAQEACYCAKPCFRSTSSLQLNTDIPNSVGTLYFSPIDSC